MQWIRNTNYNELRDVTTDVGVSLSFVFVLYLTNLSVYKKPFVPKKGLTWQTLIL